MSLRVVFSLKSISLLQALYLLLKTAMAPCESSNSIGGLSSLPNDTPKEVDVVNCGLDGDSKLEELDCSNHLPMFVKIHFEGNTRETKMIPSLPSSVCLSFFCFFSRH